MEYRCERCNYTTNKMCNIKMHFSRKVPCNDLFSIGKSCVQLLDELTHSISTNVYECELCHRSFKTAQAKSKHVISCKQIELHNLMVENERIKNELLKLKESNTTNITTNNNTTNNITNNITVVLNDFGNESISHIVNDKEFLDGCLKRLLTTAIEEIIEKVYYDDEHPENRNILMKNKKLNQVVVHSNGEWKCRNISSPAAKMLCNGKNIITTHYIENGHSQITIDKMIEEGDLGIDKKIVYLQKLADPNTNEHKIAISKVKGVICNFRQ